MKLLVRQWVFACLLGTSVWGTQAAASGLQVSPVTLILPGNQNATGLWLSNEGDNVVNAQVRIYRWSQSNFSDNLTASQSLVASPPMLALAPGERQLIRIIRVGPTSNSLEDAYRLAIDELPPPILQKNKLQFVLHYSVPVFIQPASMPVGSVKLQWGLVHVGNKAFLEVNNLGNSHAQLSAATYVSAKGTRKDITPGLLGYVLPGATMRWILPVSYDNYTHGSKIEVTINGEKTLQDL
ncbi:P pilus assembly protein chaperone PapD-like protein [Serratia sp. M24T3]|nr:P pilus assembly protein chaperone PapD-like protein [Serratia sp. M24T3]